MASVMDIQVHSTTDAGTAHTIALSDDVFGCAFKESLVHQVVTAHLAGARSGSKAQKSRSQAKGGGAKPWRQKGTGRARSGTTRSPLWRSGGRAFAAQPRSFEQKINRKMYRGALRAMLSELIRQDRLLVVDQFDVEAPRTKLLVEALKSLALSEVLIITDELSDNLSLASRNIPDLVVIETGAVNPILLVGFEKIMVTKKALADLETMLK